jgi:hypothetical protein
MPQHLAETYAYVRSWEEQHLECSDLFAAWTTQLLMRMIRLANEAYEYPSRYERLERSLYLILALERQFGADVSSTRILGKIHETTTDRPDQFIRETLDPCLVRVCFSLDKSWKVRKAQVDFAQLRIVDPARHRWIKFDG